ncbi:MAG: galactose-1-phosphate uridylyltransferase [Candidatus Rokubacteria bacterium]|nr:galactose-1-phosphate uridylyltransferase [Candidatus Rokubacteria bacterium]
MSELRLDLATGEWVILATERARRPHDFKRAAAAGETPRETCPFCPGREALTPRELYREPGDGPWSVRVVPNKFPALSACAAETAPVSTGPAGMFLRRPGRGHHEVIVESPEHGAQLPGMSREAIAAVLGAYRARYRALRRTPDDAQLIIIFKNCGEEAGTSLSHPHSQLVATPVVPLWIQTKHAVARRYWDVNGRCLYCDLLDAELAQKERVLFETEGFGVFHPFASRLPFETWIMPKRHTPSFGDVRDDELLELAEVLRTTFRLLGSGLGPFPYNYVIHSAPAGEEDRRFYLWHLEILPRLTMIAGFEMGSRIFINTAAPEATAAFLRSLAPEAAPE